MTGKIMLGLIICDVFFSLFSRGYFIEPTILQTTNPKNKLMEEVTSRLLHTHTHTHTHTQKHCSGCFTNFHFQFALYDYIGDIWSGFDSVRVP